MLQDSSADLKPDSASRRIRTFGRVTKLTQKIFKVHYYSRTLLKISVKGISEPYPTSGGSVKTCLRVAVRIRTWIPQEGRRVLGWWRRDLLRILVG